MYTEAQLNRIMKDMRKMSGTDAVKIHTHDSTIQVFGDELAILRIANNYENKKAKYSKNLESWYITIVD